MTDLEVCSAAIEECDRSPEGIDACLVMLKPIIAPYYEEDGYEKRFAEGFRASMKMPIPGMKARAQEVVKSLLDGPTHAEQQEKIKAAHEAEVAEIATAMEEGEHVFISTLLAKIGFREGDTIPVRRGGGTHLITLEEWTLPEVGAEPGPSLFRDKDKDKVDEASGD